MNGNDLFDAMTAIDDSLIERAEYPERRPKVGSLWLKRTAALVACLCLAVLIGAVSGVFTKEKTPPFVLDAYADDVFGNAVANQMPLCEDIPVTLYSKGDRSSVFVFSYDRADGNQVPKNIVVYSPKYGSAEMSGVQISHSLNPSPVAEKGKTYIYYVSGGEDDCSFTYRTPTDNEGKVYEIRVSIFEKDHHYFARLNAITEIDPKEQ